MLARFALLFAFALSASPATAQFGNEWVEFERVDGRILRPGGTVAGHVTADTVERDFAWGDLDRDGWVDLVIVRKRANNIWPKALPNQLLMNEGGILVDRTAQYASASDVPGFAGFLTPTVDREAVLVDVDLDGWLDVVTATNPATGEPAHVGIPRVYRNLGLDALGHWRGLRHEGDRMPSFSPAPQFNAVAAGDVTGDGFPDLYFADSGDLDDKLLFNDGTGHFTEAGSFYIPFYILSDAEGIVALITDVDGDGNNDIVRCSGNNGPGLNASRVTIAYNHPTAPGFFTLARYQNNVASSSPYAVAVGDLNNDLQEDVVYGDDGLDGYRYNHGNDASGLPIWGPLTPYGFLSGGDDGWTGKIRLADLDGDGWLDSIHASSDPVYRGCDYRAHVYHNTGGTPGGAIVLIEEAEFSVGGWRGAKPFLPSDLFGTIDVAVFDLDNDGDLDLVFARCSGTFVWLNRRFDCPTVPYSYGHAVANSTGQPAVIASNGATSLSVNQLVLSASHVPPLVNGLFLYGSSRLWSAAPFGNGNLWIGGTVRRLSLVGADAQGAVSFAADVSVTPLTELAPGDVRDFQFWYRDPAAGGAGSNVSNALEIVFCP